MPNRYLTVVPAYGRDYKSQKEVLAAWKAGHDFYIQDPFQSGYVNKDDDLQDNLVINVRYNQQRKVFPITPKHRKAANNG